ncbi:hypothetical protein Mpsy_2856 [Methanolobus psychrophilus R15]|nr:hypothetical protein Mpsy_2856 [Methanolobus psychrophilus R15]
MCRGTKGIDTYPEDPPAMVPRGSWEPAHLKEPGNTHLSHTLLISVSVGLLTVKVTAYGNPASVLAGWLYSTTTALHTCIPRNRLLLIPHVFSYTQKR